MDKHTCRPVLEMKSQELVAKDFFQNLVGYFVPAMPEHFVGLPDELCGSMKR